MTYEESRQKLLQLKSELQEQNEAFKATGEPVELDQAKVGRLSRMDAMQAQEMALASARRRQDQLVKIEGALHRIEAGHYGHCFVCSEQIDPRRLAADPTITRCTGCAGK